jgi:hypothetical protein
MPSNILDTTLLLLYIQSSGAGIARLVYLNSPPKIFNNVHSSAARQPLPLPLSKIGNIRTDTRFSPMTGYRLDHIILRISDSTHTLHFYTKLMGMRLVFSCDVGPKIVYYLGYPERS